MDQVSNEVLLELLEAKRFGVEYQPIVELKTGDTFAYEALSRFKDARGEYIRPDYVYAALHDSPLSLYQVEFDQKKIQFGHLSNHETVFVNLDQDAFFASEQRGKDNPFIKLIEGAGRERVVVELIENSEMSDAVMSLSMIEVFDDLCIETALDDLCNPRSMLSVSVLQLVGWVKLDRFVLQKRADSNFMAFVSRVVDFAHVTGKKVVLEGIEKDEDLLFARSIGVDYVQGFYYQKRFLNY